MATKLPYDVKDRNRFICKYRQKT